MVRFAELPNARGSSGIDWSRVAEALRESPGEWAEIATDVSYGTYTAVYVGHIGSCKPVNGFEVRTRNNHYAGGKRRCDLWMRFNPEKVKPLAAALNNGRKGK